MHKEECVQRKMVRGFYDCRGYDLLAVTSSLTGAPVREFVAYLLRCFSLGFRNGSNFRSRADMICLSFFFV